MKDNYIHFSIHFLNSDTNVPLNGTLLEQVKQMDHLL